MSECEDVAVPTIPKRIDHRNSQHNIIGIRIGREPKINLHFSNKLPNPAITHGILTNIPIPLIAPPSPPRILNKPMRRIVPSQQHNMIDPAVRVAADDTGWASREETGVSTRNADTDWAVSYQILLELLDC